MDTFSDGDFLWTEASSQDSDTDNNIKMAVDKMSNSHRDEDSESGKSYKKNLQKQLFNGDTLNISQKVEPSKQTRKRKIKKEKREDSESPIKKRIKTEPESDIEIPTEKKKSKHNGFNDTQNDSQESVHESFLNLKVKEEKIAFAMPTTKKKKKGNEIQHSSQEFDKQVKISDSRAELKNSNGNCEHKFEETINEELQEDSEVRRKKKKRKLKKIKDDTSDSDRKEVIEDLFSAEETVVEKRKKKKKKSKEKIKNESTKETSDEKDEFDCHFENKTTENILINASINNSGVHNSGKETCNNSLSVNSDNNEYDTTVEMKTNKSNIDETLSSDISAVIQTPRIPKIVFEDDLDSEASYKQNKLEKSSRMKNYINGNPNLKPMQPVLNSNQIITKDDDIWIFNCPNDFDINALESRDIVLDKKSTKIKINGQTYESVLNENTDSVVICSVQNGEHVINNLPFKGTITFHKKIPKLHFSDIVDNTTVNDKIKVFPLSEIKCRHPLFGSHYKRDIKISKTVTEKLKVTDNSKEQDNEAEQIRTKQTKKKKHKQMKNTQKEIKSILAETNFEYSKSNIEDSYEELSDNNKKKKRKRTTDNDEELVPKKTKKLKHDSNSAEAWESEKTIEQNLFNF